MKHHHATKIKAAVPGSGAPRSHRASRICLALALLLVLAVAALLALGLPQRRLIPVAAQRVLGAEVSMTVRRTWGRVELGDILVREPGAPELPPLVRAESLSMPWTLSGPRHVPSLCIAGLEINLDATDPQRPNYGWVKRFLAQPSSGFDTLPWTPVDITVTPLRFSAKWPDGAFAVEGAGAKGLVLSAAVPGAHQYRVALAGDDAEIRWTLPGLPPQDFANNRVDLRVETDDAGYAGAIDLALPKEDRVKGSFRYSREGPEAKAEAALKDTVLRQPVWSELAGTFSPVPVRFVALECPALEARLTAGKEGWRLEQANLHLGVKGLSVGPAPAPWFSGDVQLASAETPKGAQFAVDARVNDLPPVQVRWTPQKDGFTLGAALEQWTPAQLSGLFPTGVRDTVTRYLPFEKVSVSAAAGPAQNGWALSGDARLQRKENAEEPLTVQTATAWEKGVLTGGATARLGESTALELKGFRFDAKSGEVTLAVKGPVDLAPFARLAGFADLWGTATLDSQVMRDGSGNIQLAPLRASFETLGYGSLGIPYGVELAVSAPVRSDEKGVKAGPVEVSLGEDTTLKASSILWSSGVLTASDLDVETGLAPLVSKGWLSAAEGHASARCAAFRWPAPEAPPVIEYDASFARLDLPAGWGSVKGLTAKGELNATAGDQPAGEASADEASLAGATLHALKAALRLYGAEVGLENLEFGLFGGKVKGGVRLSPLGQNLPVSFTAEVDQLDLGTFTKEYKPPSTRLTGLMSGRVSASLDLAGLEALDVDLRADEGLSMNRDLVEQLLASEYLSGMSGGKQVTQVLRDVVGEAPQIPFKRAAVRLGMESGRITGTARLESDKLNLTLDIKADPGAVMEALRARSGGDALEKMDK